MSNLAITYENIADILSYKTPNFKLEKKIDNPSFDWDSVVIESSRHLVLPAIYCRLKSKNLLHLLPEELVIYLKEITNINRNRNEAILKQCYSISQIFKRHQIKHVFLKGSALLALNCFSDNAERMIGDIDILISSDQIDAAYELLKNNDYTAIQPTLKAQFIEHKHLPRLKPNKHISSVELHHKLFVSYNFNMLNCNAIFNKRICIDNIPIPSHKHLLIHNILNFQINDKGALYNSISFRSSYDTITLLKDFKGIETLNNHKIFKSYFGYNGLFFQDIKDVIKTSSDISTSFYLFKLKHIRFYKFWNRLIFLRNFIPILTNRLYLFVRNKSYRNAIIKDQKRIYQHFKGFLNDS